jgi:hypothetical protein
MYLQRYHDVEISASGVRRILKRLGMNRLPASERYKRHTGRWKRYEKQRPGNYVQIDVKFIEPITAESGRRKRYYQYTAIDDCTRLRVPRAYPRSDQKTAIQFLDYVLSRLPFQVEKIQTDNGAEFAIATVAQQVLGVADRCSASEPTGAQSHETDWGVSEVIRDA